MPWQTWNKTVWSIAYKISSPCHRKTLPDQFMVGLIAILEQSPLDTFLPVLWHMHRLKSAGVKAGKIHTGGNGHRSGSKILHLFSVKVIVTDVLGKFYHVRNGAARMPRHEIRDQVLPFLLSLLLLFEPLPE